jgi:hypothetical protein
MGAAQKLSAFCDPQFFAPGHGETTFVRTELPEFTLSQPLR